MTDVLIKKSEVQETVKLTPLPLSWYLLDIGLEKRNKLNPYFTSKLILVLHFLQFSNMLLQFIKYYFMYKVHIMNKYNKKSDTCVHPIHQK